VYELLDAGAGTTTASEFAAVERLVSALSSPDGLERRDARKKLVKIGRPAVQPLLAVVKSPNVHMRWEAVKALGEICDLRAAPVLVDALQDQESAVRWLAARGLIALGRQALIPLLKALEDESDSIWMREGARHVLHSLPREVIGQEIEAVLEALEGIEPSVEAPYAAFNALQALEAEEEHVQSVWCSDVDQTT
jgi:hypothetical protein